MRHVWLVLIFLFRYQAPQLHAQSPQLKDSLWAVWNNPTHYADTARMHALNDLIGTSYCRQSPDSAILLSHQVIALAEKSKDYLSMGTAWYNIGVAHDAKGEHQQSYESQVKATDFLKRTSNKLALAKSYAGMGTAARYMGQFVKSLECHQLAYDTHKEIGNQKGMAGSISAMGNVYLAQGYRSSNQAARDESNLKALEHFNRALKLGEELGDKKIMAMALNNTGLVFHEMGRIQESKTAHEKVLQMSVEMNNEMYRSNALNNLGVAHEALSDAAASTAQRDSLLNIALQYYQQSYETRKTLGQIDLVTNSMTNIAALKRRMALNGPASDRPRLLEESAQIARECFELTNESGNLSERSHAAQALYEVYKAQGKYQDALASYEVYITTRDSINSEDQRAELLRQELTYDFEKKELEKTRAYEQDILQQRNQRNLLFAGGAILLVIVLFLVNSLRVRRKAALLLTEKNKQVEAAKEAAVRSEQSKQKFLANMSHEIRTPMNAITGLSRLLLDKEHDEQTKAYLSAIRHSSENLTVVLNDVLDQAKIEAGKLEIHTKAFDLRATVNSWHHMWSAKAIEKNLVFSVDISPEIAHYVQSDSARLTQIMTNLIGNAIKFTDRGSVQLQVKRQDNQLHFVVRDTGPGIAPHERTTIFESFRQSESNDLLSKGGTGLGLSIAQQLAGLLGGHIEVESQLGQGSTFVLHLPYIEALASDIVMEQPIGINTTPLAVLVAEDNEYNFIVTHDTILKYFPQAQIVRAHHGREVIDAMEEDEYDLVLMDVQMPQMDGYEATKHIRTKDSKTPIIGITASVLGTDIAQCLDAGMQGYIPKPFTESEFVQAINQVLHKTLTPLPSEKDQIHEHALFLAIIPDKIKALQMSITASDEQSIRDLAHTLRPQLINNQLDELAACCLQLQQSTSPVDMATAQRLLNGLEEALNKKKL